MTEQIYSDQQECGFLDDLLRMDAESITIAISKATAARIMVWCKLLQDLPKPKKSELWEKSKELAYDDLLTLALDEHLEDEGKEFYSQGCAWLKNQPCTDKKAEEYARECARDYYATAHVHEQIKLWQLNNS